MRNVGRENRVVRAPCSLSTFTSMEFRSPSIIPFSFLIQRSKTAARACDITTAELVFNTESAFTIVETRLKLDSTPKRVHEQFSYFRTYCQQQLGMQSENAGQSLNTWISSSPPEDLLNNYRTNTSLKPREVHWVLELHCSHSVNVTRATYLFKERRKAETSKIPCTMAEASSGLASNRLNTVLRLR